MLSQNLQQILLIPDANSSKQDLRGQRFKCLHKTYFAWTQAPEITNHMIMNFWQRKPVKNVKFDRLG